MRNDLYGCRIQSSVFNPLMLRDVKPPIIAGIPEVVAQPPPVWEGRSIAGPKLRLKEFISFLSLQSSKDGGNRVETEVRGTPSSYFIRRWGQITPPCAAIQNQTTSELQSSV